MNRNKALSLGLHTYNTNKPCVNGHTSDRYVANYQCIECSRAGQKAFNYHDYHSNYRVVMKEQGRKSGKYYKKTLPPLPKGFRATYNQWTAMGIVFKDIDEAVLWFNKVKDPDSKCAICSLNREQVKSLHLDHDHISGKPRDILCFRCNIAEGRNSKDSAFIEYREKHKTQ